MKNEIKDKMIAFNKQFDHQWEHGIRANPTIVTDRPSQGQSITELPKQEESRGLRDGEATDSTPSEATSHGAARHAVARNKTRTRVSAKSKPATKRRRSKSKLSSNP